jgi:hypothetical protein
MLAAAALAAPAALFAASRPEAEQAKIDRLLEEIRASGATFIRNGRDYDGPRAAGHLKRKLFFAGARVQTARDFVLGIASKSEESGRPYLVRFAGSPARPLCDWLLERLAEIEKPSSASAPTRRVRGAETPD